MIRRSIPALAALALLTAPLAAQLPLITVPRGALRIELGGAFYPTDDEWVNGTKQGLGTSLTANALDASSSPMIAILQSSLAQILGRAASPGSLGGLTTIASHERGVGSIGLGLGLTRKISLFTTIPIVLVRTRASLTYDASTANVGINPADPYLGTQGGAAQTGEFFSEFDAALTALSDRVAHGDYANDPTALALAQQTLTTAPALRSQLRALLVNAGASAVLPTATSADGLALLAQISALRNTFNNQLGIAGLGSAPALPTSPLSATDFEAMLSAPSGFGLSPLSQKEHFALGDIDAGITAELAHHGAPGDAGWFGAWVRGAVRFPSGQRPDPSVLLDQGTGTRDLAMSFGGILEVGRRRWGVRGNASYQHQMTFNDQTRIARPDQMLVPFSFAAIVSRQPGDVFAVTAEPFFHLAPHLALTGMLQYWRQGASTTRYAAGQAPIATVDPASMDIGTAANATLIGFGLSYAHEGRESTGKLGLPVEAAWSIERTIASGAGIVPAPLTSRVTFRIYKALFKP